MGSRITCDVLVVGGGPAGTTAAYELARRGIDVALFDRRIFPRQKLCAGLLTKKTIRLVEEIFGSGLSALKADHTIYHTLRDYHLYKAPSQLMLKGRLEFPFHLVDRFHYDHYWLSRARKLGVRVHTWNAIDTVNPDTGRAVADDGTIVQSRIIIAADGVHSRIRARLFPTTLLKKDWWPQLAQTIEVKIPIDGIASHLRVASLYFGFIPWGYAWSFPGGDQLILGICGLPAKADGTSIKKGFHRFIRALGLSPDRLGPLHSHPLPYGNFLATPAKARVLLAGDACGLADPLLGEGIFYAHKSGQLAAKAILEAGLAHEAAGKGYQRRLNKSVYNEFRWIRFFRTLMFIGGRHRKFRCLKLLFRLKRQTIEKALQGDHSYQRILWP